MPSTRIDAITASCFRGATTRTKIQFSSDQKIVFLFGENGTGKSTIIDAIDAVCNQNVGSLDERNAATAGHIPSIGKRPGDVVVTLTAARQTWTATMRGSKISVSPQTHTPSVTILRRSKILALVIAQPAKRYDQLKAFIEVDGVEKSEAALRKAINDAERKSGEAAKSMSDAELHLKQAYQAEHTLDEERSTPLEWARKRTQLDLNALTAHLDVFEQILNWNTRIQALLTPKNASSKESVGNFGLG